jgi:hypothetical protein
VRSGTALCSDPEQALAADRAANLLRALVLVAACVVMALRAPLLLRQPRFWAEEGKVYFAYAYAADGLWRALLAPHQGYYHLFANLATVLALLVPVRHAPMVTTLLAFAAQALPLAIVLWGKAPLWRTLPRSIVAVAIILLTPSSAECWLNAINSQFYLALSAALLLLEETPEAVWRRWAYRGILALAALSGPVTAFLTPLFAVRAWAHRSDREAGTQAWMVGAGAMLQLGIVLTSLEIPPEGAVRFAGLGPANLLAVIANRTIVMPLASSSAAQWVCERLVQAHDAGSDGLIAFGLVVALGALGTFLCWKRPSSQRYLLAASLLLTTLSTISALISAGQTKWVLVWPGTAIRYYYAPSVLLMMAFWGRVDTQPKRWRRPASLLAALALTVGLVLGAADYRPLMQPFVSDDWPVWQEEVAVWETRPGYRLEIWPPPWDMQLVRWD